ncbi:MAG TPA: hypothetical protein VFZ99_01690 [Terriglobales bacterium]
MIFVRGHCIGKHASSYASQAGQPGFSNERIHELLKEQHRTVLQSVREGRIEEFLRSTGEVHDVEGDGLTVKWVNAEISRDKQSFTMQLMVTDLGSAAEGALITCRIVHVAEGQIHSHAVTDAHGAAELEVDLRSLSPQDANPVLLVRAMHGDKSTARQYRLKRNS